MANPPQSAPPTSGTDSGINDGATDDPAVAAATAAADATAAVTAAAGVAGTRRGSLPPSGRPPTPTAVPWTAVGLSGPAAVGGGAPPTGTAGAASPPSSPPPPATAGPPPLIVAPPSNPPDGAGSSDANDAVIDDLDRCLFRDSELLSLVRPDAAGFLWRKSPLSGWRRYWHSLARSSLYYFEKRDAPGARRGPVVGCIPLFRARAALAGAPRRCLRLEFDLTDGQGRVHVLRAESQAELHGWLRAVALARNTLPPARPIPAAGGGAGSAVSDGAAAAAATAAAAPAADVAAAAGRPAGPSPTTGGSATPLGAAGGSGVGSGAAPLSAPPLGNREPPPPQATAAGDSFTEPFDSSAAPVPVATIDAHLPVGAVLCVVHGVGASTRTLSRNVAALQAAMATVMERVLPDVDFRTQLLVVHWRRALTGTAVHRRLQALIPTEEGWDNAMRSFISDKVADLHFYSQPVYRALILREVAEQLNAQWRVFRARHPDFAGPVAIYGHSLGSVISYELLAAQARLAKADALRASMTATAGASASSACGHGEGGVGEAAGGGAATTPRPPSAAGDAATASTAAASSAAATANEAILFPTPESVLFPGDEHLRLVFSADTLFTVGSPLGQFLTLDNTLSPALADPATLPFRLHNYMHPNDPVALRVEPWVDPRYALVPPVTVPHWQTMETGSSAFPRWVGALLGGGRGGGGGGGAAAAATAATATARGGDALVVPSPTASSAVMSPAGGGGRGGVTDSAELFEDGGGKSVDRPLPMRRYSLPLLRTPGVGAADAPSGGDGSVGVTTPAAAVAAVAPPLQPAPTPSGGAARRLANNAAVAGVDDTPATAAATVAATTWPRMDYVVQLESAMEEVSSSYSALKAHTDCWGSRDTALCLLTALLRRAAGSSPADHPRVLGGDGGAALGVISPAACAAAADAARAATVADRRSAAGGGGSGGGGTRGASAAATLARAEAELRAAVADVVATAVQDAAAQYIIGVYAPQLEEGVERGAPVRAAAAAASAVLSTAAAPLVLASSRSEGEEPLPSPSAPTALPNVRSDGGGDSSMLREVAAAGAPAGTTVTAAAHRAAAGEGSSLSSPRQRPPARGGTPPGDVAVEATAVDATAAAATAAAATAAAAAAAAAAVDATPAGASDTLLAGAMRGDGTVAALLPPTSLPPPSAKAVAPPPRAAAGRAATPAAAAALPLSTSLSPPPTPAVAPPPRAAAGRVATPAAAAAPPSVPLVAALPPPAAAPAETVPAGSSTNPPEGPPSTSSSWVTYLLSFRGAPDGADAAAKAVAAAPPAGTANGGGGAASGGGGASGGSGGVSGRTSAGRGGESPPAVDGHTPTAVDMATLGAG